MKRILIIEDEKSIRDTLQDILELEGFETLSAADGLAGIQMAQRHTPDLILCDVMMPKKDGYHVLQTLQKSAETEAIPFIFLTAKADNLSLRQGMNLGADDYWTKPFTPQAVVEALKTRLQKRLAQTQACIQPLRDLAKKLDSQRYHDPLKNLPNRLLLQQSFERLTAIADQDRPLIPLLHLNQNCETVNFYFPHLRKQIQQRFEIETDLHHALERQQIQVYYQPQFDLHTGQLLGAEALIRWFHPKWGSISPTELSQFEVRIAIDDFGVGYSSFSYLQKFSLSTLKIDRCLIKRLAKDKRNQKIVAAIIKMAHDIGIQVAAEGVEQETDLKLLRQLDCDVAQGFWFSPPSQGMILSNALFKPQKCISKMIGATLARAKLTVT